MTGLLAASPSPVPREEDRAEMGRLVTFTAATQGSPFPTPFGSSVVETRTGRLVARRPNQGRQKTDPTAHAEVQAVRAACRRRKSTSLQGCTLYTTCEPCPMCMAALLWARLDRVVFGATIADAAEYFDQIYIPAKTLAKKGDMICEVVGPIERTACQALFAAVARKK